MQTRTHMFQHELGILIAAEIERLKENLAAGGLKSFEDYRHTSGQISGLRMSLDLMEEAEAICNGKPRQS